MSILELHHVSKVYGEGETEVDAITDIDLSVDRGSLVAIMGPSGSGKSTLLTIAGSLEEPTSGDVVINGARLRDMSRNDRARLRRRSVGYVFQDFNLLAGLTAVENVSLPLELDGIPMKKAAARRRTIGRPRFGQRRVRDANDPGRLSRRRGGGRRDPRRETRVVGRSGRVPARRQGRR